MSVSSMCAGSNPISHICHKVGGREENVFIVLPGGQEQPVQHAGRPGAGV